MWINSLQPIPVVKCIFIEISYAQAKRKSNNFKIAWHLDFSPLHSSLLDLLIALTNLIEAYTVF